MFLDGGRWPGSACSELGSFHQPSSRLGATHALHRAFQRRSRAADSCREREQTPSGCARTRRGEIRGERSPAERQENMSLSRDSGGSEHHNCRPGGPRGSPICTWLGVGAGEGAGRSVCLPIVIITIVAPNGSDATVLNLNFSDGVFFAFEDR